MQRSRDPMNELHVAARDGSTERTVAALSKGVIDIDEGTEDLGNTPLMLAADAGHSRIVRILLNKGANVSVVDGDGFAALHMAADEGHLAVTKLLVKANADLEAEISTTGCTPLYMAAHEGHSQVMRVLIEAGANPNSRASDGATPLYNAAQRGRIDAIKLLLHAKADPLLTFSTRSGYTFLPLDVAAGKGHSEVVRELIQEHGIKGCGGASCGVNALLEASVKQHVETMRVLTSAGVVDTGEALLATARRGRESSKKLLLQLRKRNISGADYLETCDESGSTPMLCSIQACRPCSRNIVRFLVDAGANTT